MLGLYQMGLAENDTIIKRRVQQKLEFMLNDSIASVEPETLTLQAYLDTHEDRFTIAPVYSFRHVFINPEKHGEISAFIEGLKSQNLDEVYTRRGDSIMLDSEYTDIPSSQIARLFGRIFVKGLDGLAEHQWTGPIKSGFGLHLVYIDRKMPRHVATLDELESEIKLSYRTEAQKKARDAFYAELRNQFELIIEKPTQ